MTRKPRKETLPSQQEPEQEQTQPWECFFRDQPYPILRSQLLTAIMAGTPLDFEHVPTRALADVALLAAVARYFCNAEIVTNWDAMIARIKELWDAPTFTHRVFSNTHLRALASVVYKGTAAGAFYDREESYLPGFLAGLLEQDAPQFFERELVLLPPKKPPVSVPAIRTTRKNPRRAA